MTRTRTSFLAGASFALAASLLSAACSTTAETAPGADKAAEPTRDPDRFGREPRDRSLPSRHGLAEGGRPGGSQRRDGRPRDRDAGRARYARRAGRDAHPHFSFGDSRAVAGSRRERRADRSQARPDAGPAVRPDEGPGRDERQGVARSRRSGVQPDALARRSEGHFTERVRPAPHAARSCATEAISPSRTSPISRIARSRARAPGSRSRARPYPTRRSGRRSTGIVAERLVSVGDYVTRGARVATVVRIDPLRVELTIPEQHVSLVKVGQQVRLTVDAYPGEEFAATVKFVSPSLRSDQRALTVEAIAPNGDGTTEAGILRHRASSSARRRPGAPRSRDRG